MVLILAATFGLAPAQAQTSSAAYRIGLLATAVDPTDQSPFGTGWRQNAAKARVRSAGLDVESLGARAPGDFDEAFSAMMKTPPDAILIVTDVLTLLNRKRVLDLAAKYKLPTSNTAFWCGTVV
ncbi:MAG TPA: hypothetical protein VL985_17280 [Stellaceae bacterium]|nr:hypothetical protein [Stellaceae bacterium]